MADQWDTLQKNASILARNADAAASRDRALRPATDVIKQLAQIIEAAIKTIRAEKKAQDAQIENLSTRIAKLEKDH